MIKDEIREMLSRRDLREIYLYIEDVLDSGFTVDEIIEMGEPYDGYFMEHAEKLLSLGATPTKLFKINEHRHYALVDQPKELIPYLMVYLKYGIDPEYVTAWIEENVRKKDIVKYSDAFRGLGIKPEKFIKEYLKQKSFKEVWDDILFGNLPDIINPNDAIDFYDIREIEHQFKHTSTCENFIKHFVRVGGSVQKLAKKYLETFKGYPEDESRLITMATLSYYGATNIDPNKIIDALTHRAYSYKDQSSMEAVNAYIYEKLKDKADETHLAKLKG